MWLRADAKISNFLGEYTVWFEQHSFWIYLKFNALQIEIETNNPAKKSKTHMQLMYLIVLPIRDGLTFSCNVINYCITLSSFALFFFLCHALMLCVILQSMPLKSSAYLM